MRRSPPAIPQILERSYFLSSKCYWRLLFLWYNRKDKSSDEDLRRCVYDLLCIYAIEFTFVIFYNSWDILVKLLTVGFLNGRLSILRAKDYLIKDLTVASHQCKVCLPRHRRCRISLLWNRIFRYSDSTPSGLRDDFFSTLITSGAIHIKALRAFFPMPVKHDNGVYKSPKDFNLSNREWNSRPGRHDGLNPEGVELHLTLGEDFITCDRFSNLPNRITECTRVRRNES